MSKLIVEIFDKNNTKFKGNIENDNDLINVEKIIFYAPFFKNVVAEVDTDEDRYFDKHLIQALLNNVNNLYNNLTSQSEFKISNPSPGELKYDFSAFLEKWTFGDNNNGELTYFDNELNKKSIHRETLELINKDQDIKLEILPDPIELSLPIISFLPLEINNFMDAQITDEFSNYLVDENIVLFGDDSKVDYTHGLTKDQLKLLNKVSIEKTDPAKIKLVADEYKLSKQNERINTTVNRRELNNFILIRGESTKNYVETSKIFLKSTSKLLEKYNFKLDYLKKQLDKIDPKNIEQFAKIYDDKELFEKLIFETNSMNNIFTKTVKILANKSAPEQLKEWAKNKFNNTIEGLSCNSASAAMNYNIFVFNKNNEDFFEVIEEIYKEKYSKICKKLEKDKNQIER